MRFRHAPITLPILTLAAAAHAVPLQPAPDLHAIAVDRGPLPSATPRLARINLNTGFVEYLGDLAARAEGLARMPDGRILGTEATVDELWDFQSPPGALVGPTGPRLGADSGLALDPVTGILYCVGGAEPGGCTNCTSLYTLDPETGAATFVGQDPATYVDSLAISAQGEAFAADFVFTHTLYRLNLQSGALTAVGPLMGGIPGALSSLDFAPDGTLWCLTGGVPVSPSRLYTIDTQTGLATFHAFTSSNAKWGGLAILPPACYPNCDGSTASPALNVADFTCFLQRFAAGDAYANCDQSTLPPTLNVADFTCFLQQFAAGCA